MALPGTVDDMLKAYFRYQYPSSGLIHEGFFWFQYQHNMLTPLLIYAMLAVATWSLVGDSDEIAAAAYGSLHEVFYRRAKQYVEDAMDEADLHSIQGLLVLSNYEVLVGRWNRVWNHTTLARRLSEGIIIRNADFPWAGVQLQNGFDFEYQRVVRAYWHSFAHDIWAAVMVDKQVSGIDIAMPPRPSHDFTFRTLQFSLSEEAPGYRVALGLGALEDPEHGATAAMGELALLVGAINNSVYLFQHASQLPGFKVFIGFEMRLTEWYRTLPADVQLDDTTVARFTATGARADLGEIISAHLFWNFARLLLMRMGLVLSLGEDPALLRNIHATKAFYTEGDSTTQPPASPQQDMVGILTSPDKAESYNQWLFQFCRYMSLQSAQNIVTLLKLGERHGVHPSYFGLRINMPLVQVVSVSLGLVRSPDAQVVALALDHLATVMRTLLRLKHCFNTALLLLHLFLFMQDPQLLLPADPLQETEDLAVDLTCPFASNHLVSKLLRRLGISFDEFVGETMRAVRLSMRGRDVELFISPLLRYLPQQQQQEREREREAVETAVDGEGGSSTAADVAAREPEWYKDAPSYMRSAWKRLTRIQNTS
ncbi:hypothetical protein GGF37_005775 [Kickxella alabastrina]|nr:hypothetical protein GGF37_005775 [Kickxella alabastrina]